MFTLRRRLRASPEDWVARVMTVDCRGREPEAKGKPVEAEENHEIRLMYQTNLGIHKNNEQTLGVGRVVAVQLLRAAVLARQRPREEVVEVQRRARRFCIKLPDGVVRQA